MTLSDIVAGGRRKNLFRIAAASILLMCLYFGAAMPPAWPQSSDQQYPVPPAPAGIPGETEPPPMPPPLPMGPRYDGGETLSDPSAVSACICGSQRVADLNQRMLASKQRFDGGTAALQEMQRALDDARTHLDVNNIDQVNAFRRLSMRREEASATFFGTTQPAYSTAVRAYNDAVARYNQECAGRGLDPATVADVRPSLICQSPELPAQ